MYTSLCQSAYVRMPKDADKKVKGMAAVFSVFVIILLVRCYIFTSVILIVGVCWCYAHVEQF